MTSDSYFLHRIEHSVLISASFEVSIVLHRSALLCQTILLKLWLHLFLSKYFGPSCHWFKCYIYFCVPNSTNKFVKNAFLFDKGLKTQILYSEVGSIVLGRFNKLTIISFLFLPHENFNSKYHLFDSLLLSRIIFINTEQDLFINWNLVLDVGQSLKIKRIYKTVCLCIALSS